MPPPLLPARSLVNSYSEAQLGVADIDFFGLYDCFPICFIRAIEAVKVVVTLFVCVVCGDISVDTFDETLPYSLHWW